MNPGELSASSENGQPADHPVSGGSGDTSISGEHRPGSDAATLYSEHEAFRRLADPNDSLETDDRPDTPEEQHQINESLANHRDHLERERRVRERFGEARYGADVLRATAAWHYSQTLLYAEMAEAIPRAGERVLECRRLSYFHEQAWQEAERKLEALRA